MQYLSHPQFYTYLMYNDLTGEQIWRQSPPNTRWTNKKIMLHKQKKNIRQLFLQISTNDISMYKSIAFSGGSRRMENSRNFNVET